MRRRRSRRRLLLPLLVGSWLFLPGCAGMIAQIMPFLSKIAGGLGPVQKLLPMVSSLTGGAIPGAGAGPGQIMNLARGVISQAERNSAMRARPAPEAPAGLSRQDTQRAEAMAGTGAPPAKTVPGFTPRPSADPGVLGQALPSARLPFLR